MNLNFTFKMFYIISLYTLYVVQRCDSQVQLEPFIEVSEGQLLEANSTFVLTCTVIVEKQVMLDFEWSYPNRNASKTRIRAKDVPLEEATEESPIGKKSSLIVKNSEVSDSGIYICFVVDDSQNAGFDKVYLPVSGGGLSLPPVLNISSEYTDIIARGTLQISCAGQHPLSWKLPVHKDEADPRLFIASDVKKGEPLYKHISTLTLDDVQFTDTGFYSCHYKDHPYLPDKTYSTNLYVFVNDPKHLFADDSAGNLLLLAKQQKEEITIPCLPTDSTTENMLYVKVEDDKYDSLKTYDNVTFSHMRGYKLHLTEKELDLSYQCRATLGNVSEELNVTFIKESETCYNFQKNNYYHPVTDVIKRENVTGGRAIIKCTFSADPEKKLFIDWSYPNKDAADFRFKEKRLFSPWKRVYDSNYIHQVTSLLYVDNFTASDNGLYYCLVIDDSQNIGWSRIWLSAFPEISDDPEIYYQPLIDITDAENPTINEKFNLRCSVTTNSADNQTLSLSWNYPNKNETGPRINETQTLSSRIKVGDIYVNELISYLIVNEAHANDSGIYTCYINGNSLNHGWDKKWIFIHEDTQLDFQVSIDTTDAQRPVVDRTFSLKCSIRAHPDLLLYIEWNYPNKHENVTRIREYDAIQEWKKIQEYYVYEYTATLTVTNAFLNDSGPYTCYVTDNSAQQVRLSSVRINVSEEDVVVDSSGLSDTTLAIIITCILLVLIALAIFFIRYYMNTIKKRKRRGFMKGNLIKGDNSNIFNPDLPVEEQIDLLPYHERWEFPKNRLKLEKTLGQGAFGRVVEAEAIGIIKGESSTIVAVKMLKETAGEEQRNALLAELKILIHVGKHLNIVNLLGAVTESIDQGELYVIVEYCCYGNLRHFLHKCKGSFTDQLNHETGALDAKKSTISDVLNIDGNKVIYTNVPRTGIENPVYRADSIAPDDISTSKVSDSISTNPSAVSRNSDYSGVPSVFWENEDSSLDYVKKKGMTTNDLLSFSFQCARGMEYLSSKKLVHRDLAARNVLLAKDYVVKICDFGLAKDCYKYAAYKKKKGGLIPVRWSALESVKDGIFTTKSDVWSFGILLWEIFTLGDTPYPGEKINHHFVKKLVRGYRMKSPDLAPTKIYEIMQNCWLADPNQRPDFSSLTENIGSFLESRLRKHYIDLNICYQEMNDELAKENDKIKLSADTGDDENTMSNKGVKALLLDTGINNEGINLDGYMFHDPAEQCIPPTYANVTFEQAEEDQNIRSSENVLPDVSFEGGVRNSVENITSKDNYLNMG